MLNIRNDPEEVISPEGIPGIGTSSFGLLPPPGGSSSLGGSFMALPSS